MNSFSLRRILFCLSLALSLWRPRALLCMCICMLKKEPFQVIEVVYMMLFDPLPPDDK